MLENGETIQIVLTRFGFMTCGVKEDGGEFVALEGYKANLWYQVTCMSSPSSGLTLTLTNNR